MKKWRVILIGIAALTILALAVSIPLYTDLDAPTQTGTLDDTGDDGCILRDMRAAAVEANHIPDDRLIAKCGDAWVSHFGESSIGEHERIIRNILDTGADDAAKAHATELSLRGINFVTLSENPALDLDEVAALQLSLDGLNGAIKAPAGEPVRRYHAFLMEHYGLPRTAGEVTDRLNRITNGMAPLAPTILETYEQWALRGVVNPVLDQQDTYYWTAVASLARCEYRAADDCADERNTLTNKSWED